MKILLYKPDNGVTRNFMPHLWMFLLQALTPAGHEMWLIDGNAQPMDESEIAQYVRDHKVGLVGIGAMTRMIAKAYRMADAVRAAGVPVVMGGRMSLRWPMRDLAAMVARAMPTPQPRQVDSHRHGVGRPGESQRRARRFSSWRSNRSSAAERAPRLSHLKIRWKRKEQRAKSSGDLG